MCPWLTVWWEGALALGHGFLFGSRVPFPLPLPMHTRARQYARAHAHTHTPLRPVCRHVSSPRVALTPRFPLHPSLPQPSSRRVYRSGEGSGGVPGPRRGVGHVLSGGEGAVRRRPCVQHCPEPPAAPRGPAQVSSGAGGHGQPWRAQVRGDPPPCAEAGAGGGGARLPRPHPNPQGAPAAHRRCGCPPPAAQGRTALSGLREIRQWKLAPPCF